MNGSPLDLGSDNFLAQNQEAIQARQVPVSESRSCFILDTQRIRETHRNSKEIFVWTTLFRWISDAFWNEPGE
jgi:hypothetical protein